MLAQLRAPGWYRAGLFTGLEADPDRMRLFFEEAETE